MIMRKRHPDENLSSNMPYAGEKKERMCGAHVAKRGCFFLYVQSVRHYGEEESIGRSGLK